MPKEGPRPERHPLELSTSDELVAQRHQADMLDWLFQTIINFIFWEKVGHPWQPPGLWTSSCRDGRFLVHPPGSPSGLVGWPLGIVGLTLGLALEPARKGRVMENLPTLQGIVPYCGCWPKQQTMNNNYCKKVFPSEGGRVVSWLES